MNALLHGEHACINKQGKPYIYAHQISVENVNVAWMLKFKDLLLKFVHKVKDAMKILKLSSLSLLIQDINNAEEAI